MLARFLIMSALFCAASACSNRPAPTVALHPPASDLTVWGFDDPAAPEGACRTEPPAPDPDDPKATVGGFRRWETDILLAGRGCRDTVRRLCAWHRASGARDLDGECGG